jgi:hypothetical protein
MTNLFGSIKIEIWDFIGMNLVHGFEISEYLIPRIVSLKITFQNRS